MVKLTEKALRGVNIVRDMLGSEAARSLQDFAASGRFGSALAQMALEFAYADNWNADGLSRREKSLVLISALVALRQPNELSNHVRLGLANGILPKEFELILVQLAPYVGFPATSTATAAMRDVLHQPDMQSGDKESGSNP